MGILRNRLRTFLDRRLHSLAARPEMWGSAESVELQALQLLHVRALVLSTDSSEVDQRDPGRIRERYISFLRARFPDAPPTPLAEHLAGEPSLQRFSELLGAFIAEELSRQDEQQHESAAQTRERPMHGAPQDDQVMTVEVRGHVSYRRSTSHRPFLDAT